MLESAHGGKARRTTMNADLERLIDLQGIDVEIARVSAEIAAHPKHIARIEAKLAGSRDRVDRVKAALRADETARRRHEENIREQQAKILKFRETSSSVKTNEQYKALLAEIGFAEKAIAAEEDKILEIMVATDARHAELKSAEAELATEIAAVAREKLEIEARTEVDRKELAGLNERRDALRALVEEAVLRHYDSVRKLRGIALAEARDQRCMACQVMLRPQVFAEVRKGDVIHHCDTCSRLFFYRAENEEPRPVTDANLVERSWMFVPSLGTSGAFVIFQNAKGNASFKAYDALTGTALEKHSTKNATYHQAFAAMLEHARNIFVDEANLEEQYKEQLPEEILADMRHQLPSPAEPAESGQPS
jgi:predicted  nucleic acid-binding Zn-ribbon protein